MVPERLKKLMLLNSRIRKVLIKVEKSRLKTLSSSNYIGFSIKGVESHCVKDVLGITYDGCHKIRLLLSKRDLKEAKTKGYNLHPITELGDLYHNSCGLRFILSWDTRTEFLSQKISPNDVQITVVDYKAEQVALIAEMEALDKEIDND